MRAVLWGVAASVLACGSQDKKAHAPETVPVRVAKVEQRSMPLTLRANGTVESSNLVAVRPQVGGVILTVGFQEGQRVKKGEVLFQIDPRPYQAALDSVRQALARDQAKADAAQADLARYEKLVGKEFVTREAYDQKKSDAAAAKATLGSDRADVQVAQLNLAYCTVRAPESGRTGALLVHAGNLVKANDDSPLVTIARIQPIRVRFSIPEAEIEALRAKQEALATFVTPKLAQTPIEGKLAFIDNAVDTQTGTLLLKAEFPNADERLWPGEFVEVRLELGEDPDAVVIPLPAVQTGQTGTFVFVVQDGAVAQREVKIARETATLAVVQEGLKVGETVVTDGQLRLVPGAKVSVTVAGAAER